MLNHQKCPPAFLQALTEVVGVTVVYLVNVAPNVITLVVVAKLNCTRVLTGVARVIVFVKRPEKIVAGGSVEVVVVLRRTVSVVVVGARIVVVILTLTSAVTVRVGASGARRSRGAAAS
tara:strand:+ start:1347 stop:1703 length:357 start_codon:yes stop_codon:yes gene_type:complete